MLVVVLVSAVSKEISRMILRFANDWLKISPKLVIHLNLVFKTTLSVKLVFIKGRFTRCDFGACDKLTTGLSHDFQLSKRFKTRLKHCLKCCDIFSDLHDNTVNEL